METVDEHLVRRLSGWRDDPDEACLLADPLAAGIHPGWLLTLYEAQAQSRHLDLAARGLQAQGEGFYTIGSAGHESNAAVAMALRPTDPALLHYRSGGFYAARATQVGRTEAVRDILLSLATSTLDPISGGRHKVFGNAGLAIIPQTSTIGSHLPRAFGLGFSLGRAAAAGVTTPWPDDAIVVTSFGDASANHSSTVGALNAAAYCTHRGIPVPVLFVCEDNGIGISTKTPRGWTEASLSHLPKIDYVSADGTRPGEVLRVAAAAAEAVRASRRPTILHLRTVRLMGHAGSDAELAYRTAAEIVRDHGRDPLVHTAANLVAHGVLTAEQVLDVYEQTRERVMAEAAAVIGTPRLASAADVMAPLTRRRPAEVRAAAARTPATDTSITPTSAGPTSAGPTQSLNLAATINATLADILATRPEAAIFGEDVAVKGGVYGVTRGLRKRFGGTRVFDTLLDEQTILGTALGAALAGFLPIPEIQYLAYLHNAEDQLRGEAASLAFFSDSQFTNGMVVRIAGLAYQKGFGGHFHNDNSVAVLRDIPGLVLAVPSHPSQAPDLLRTCVAMAAEEGRVCVFLEPIALYHQKDLLEGDGGWLSAYVPAHSGPAQSGDEDVFERVSTFGDGADLLIVTFGNGVRMSLCAAARLRQHGIAVTVLDLRWLAPLPEDDLVAHARRFARLLVVDETRRSGGVAEGVLAVLADHAYDGVARRVTSRDSFIPLGGASELVLLSEDDIVAAAAQMCGSDD